MKEIPNRNTYIDIIKGICIIFMVWGHSNGPFTNWIYLFHMSVFFMVSGFCWNKKHSINKKSCGKYILKKIIGLYIPCVLCNGIFTLFNNLFVFLGVYSNNSQFIIVAGNGATYGLIDFLSAKQIFLSIVKCFVFDSAQLGGATWFLAALFVVTIFHCIVEGILYKFKIREKYRIVLFIIFSLIFVLLAWIANKFTLPSVLDKIDIIFAGYSAYLLGIIYKNINERLIYRWYWGLLCLAILVFLCVFLNRDGQFYITNINNPVTFYLSAIVAFYLWMYVSKVIPTISRHILERIGQQTLPIVLLHFLAFKIVSYIYLLITNGNILLLASFPVITEGTPSFLWIIYTLVGITLPLAVYWIYLKVKVRIKKMLLKVVRGIYIKSRE